ncbi:MAG: hypothetical protein ACYDGN_17130 [Acidimicrobiales bacterium]
MSEKLKPGAVVYVPWGLQGRVRGHVVEVWGDPPVHVRVELELEGEGDTEGPLVLLLAPSVVEAA